MDCGSTDRYGVDQSDFAKMKMKISLLKDSLKGTRKVRMVPEEKKVKAKIRKDRLEFDAEVQLHSIYEVY